jgi:hypothetical protein
MATYQKAPSIDEALHILDIIAQQEQIARSNQANFAPPGVLDK